MATTGLVTIRFTMSLDGFIAGPDDNVMPLFGWYFSGNVEFPLAGTDRKMKVSSTSAVTLEEMFSSYGAIVTGRRDFDVSRAWGGRSPFGVPCFIVTHNPPQEWLGEDSPFTFVTEGVERAVELAKRAAGMKKVDVGGTQIVQQALRAGLVDEIEIDLVPILLGSGIRLFDQLGSSAIQLEIARVIDAPGVTHLRYRVVK
jgi:dihydrofolate reductase